jgi:hypothetical protein
MTAAMFRRLRRLGGATLIAPVSAQNYLRRVESRESARHRALGTGGDRIDRSQIQDFGVAGQVEKRLRECTGGDLG